MISNPSPSLLLAALASFAVGFVAVRWVERGAPQPERAALTQRVIAEPAVEKVDDSSAASKARIDAIFASVEKQPGDLRDHARYAALRRLDAGDFLTAAADLQALIERVKKEGWYEDARAEFLEAWMDRWIELDAPGALRFLGGSPFLGKLLARQEWGRHQEAAIVACAAFRALARREPQWTREFLAAQPPAPQRDAGIYALLDQVARQDPSTARKFLASFSGSVNRSAAMQGYVAGLSAVDARAGFDAAAAEPAGPFRYKLIGEAVIEAAKGGVAQVRELLDRIDDPAVRLELASASLRAVHDRSADDPLPWIIEEWQRAPASAGQTGGQRIWMMAIADAVQGGKTAPAAEWAATLANDPERIVFGKIVDEWASKNPAALRAWLAQSAPALDAAAVGKLSDQLASLARADRAAVQAWADSLPPGPLREQAQFQVALSAGAEGDLARAAALYDSTAMRDTGGEIARQLAIAFAGQDGAAATEWAMRRAEGPVRTAAVFAATAEWTARDPRAVAEWLGQMAAGLERDVATSAYAWRISYVDPAAAAAWAEQVADPKGRARAADSVFFSWHGENPRAALAWVRGLQGVDEAWRKELLRGDRWKKHR